MVQNESLKFVKKQNGNVLLLKKADNSFIASFIPSLTIERDKDNANRFEVMSQYIDYRSIDCDACSPVIVAANYDEFLIELSEKFFFLNKKNCCNKFGRVTRKDKGVYNCVLNTGEGLESGDIVSLWADLDTYWETAIYLGGNLLDNNNFSPLTTHNMGTTCSLPVDAIVSDWSMWSGCVSGHQTRTRTIIIPAYNGGNTPVLLETQNCTVYSGPYYYLQGQNTKSIKVIGRVKTDKIKSTVKVYFDDVLVDTNIFDIVSDVSYDSIGGNIGLLAQEGVTVRIEHIVEPTNDVAVKSEIRRALLENYNSIISSETVVGSIGNIITNTLTFISPNNTRSKFYCYAGFV